MKRKTKGQKPWKYPKHRKKHHRLEWLRDLEDYVRVNRAAPKGTMQKVYRTVRTSRWWTKAVLKAKPWLKLGGVRI